MNVNYVKGGEMPRYEWKEGDSPIAVIGELLRVMGHEASAVELQDELRGKIVLRKDHELRIPPRSENGDEE